MMRLLMPALIVAAVGATTPAHAGLICVNGNCGYVPGVYAATTVSMTGDTVAIVGLDGGPGIAPTGTSNVVVKPDNATANVRVNGASQGRWGATNDFGRNTTRVYLGPQGCKQFGDGVDGGPCKDPPPHP